MKKCVCVPVPSVRLPVLEDVAYSRSGCLHHPRSLQVWVQGTIVGVLLDFQSTDSGVPRGGVPFNILPFEQSVLIAVILSKLRSRAATSRSSQAFHASRNHSPFAISLVSCYLPIIYYSVHQILGTNYLPGIMSCS